MTKLPNILAPVLLLLSGCATAQTSDVTSTEQCEVIADHLKTDWSGKRLDSVDASNKWGGGWSRGSPCRWKDYGVAYTRPSEGSEGAFTTILPPKIDGETATVSTIVSFGPHTASVSLCHMQHAPDGWVRTGCRKDESIEF